MPDSHPISLTFPVFTWISVQSWKVIRDFSCHCTYMGHFLLAAGVKNPPFFYPSFRMVLVLVWLHMDLKPGLVRQAAWAGSPQAW